ncbi:MAG: prepilin peptidase [Clostridia bacterium]|nr:prepilin peptidase [Clostridia bacterium]
MNILYVSAAAAGGLVIGCFLNTLAYRLTRSADDSDRKREQKLVTGSCFCPHCGHTLSLWEQIPILGYLILGGKCRCCKKPIALHYPLTEGGCAVLYAVLAAVGYPHTLPVTATGFVFSVLITGLLVYLLGGDVRRIPLRRLIGGGGLLLWYHLLIAVILGMAGIVGIVE